MGATLDLLNPKIGVFGQPMWITYDTAGGRILRLFRYESGILTIASRPLIGLSLSDTVMDVCGDPATVTTVYVAVYVTGGGAKVYKSTGDDLSIISTLSGQGNICPRRLFINSLGDIWMAIGIGPFGGAASNVGIYKWDGSNFTFVSSGREHIYGALDGEVTDICASDDGSKIYTVHTFTFDSVPNPDDLFIISESTNDGANFTDIFYFSHPTGVAQGPGNINYIGGSVYGIITRDGTGCTTFKHVEGATTTGVTNFFQDLQFNLQGYFFPSNPNYAFFVRYIDSGGTKSTYKATINGATGFSSPADFPISGTFQMPYNGFTVHRQKLWMAVANHSGGNVGLTRNGGSTWLSLDVPDATNIRGLSFAGNNF